MSSPFVGREDDLAKLDGILERAASYHAPQMVIVVGNEGTGKTRLLAEWAAGVEEPARVWKGTAVAGARYSAVAGMLRRRAGIAETDDGEAARGRFRELAQSVLGDRRVGEVVHFLGSFLGYRYADSPFLRAFEDNPRQHDEIARSLLRHFIEVDAGGLPLVLIFDQLEAADEDTLTLIEELGEGLAGSPVVLAAAARPELLVRHPKFGGGAVEADATRIELRNLAPELASNVVVNLLAPCDAVLDALVDDAVAMTGGNPGFIEELVRLFLVNGTLDTTKVPWQLDSDKAAATKLPISVEQAINARIAALDAGDRELLEMASVFGNVFWRSAMVAMSRAEAASAPPAGGWDDDPLEVELDARIEALAQKDYLLRLPAGDSTVPDDVEVVFKHNLERDLVAQMIDVERRRRYHRVAAGWLELKLVERSEEHLDLLGQLHERAGEPRRAAGFYLAAANEARNRFANVQAVDLYQRALGLLGDDDAVLGIDGHHDLGGVLALMGDADAAEVQFSEMLRLAWRFDHPAKAGAAHSRLGRIQRQRGDFTRALAHFQAASVLFERAGDLRGVAGVLGDVGIVHWQRGAYNDALDRHGQALALRRSLGDPRSIALSLANLGRVHHDLGAFPDALSHFREAFEIRREIEDRPGMVSSLCDLGAVHYADGRFDTAHEIYGEALRLAREVGDRGQRARALGGLGEVLLALGRNPAAMEALLQADQLAVANGDGAAQCESARRLADAALVKGDQPAAEAQARRALELAEKLGSRVHVGSAQRVLAEALAAGEGAGADHFFRSAIKLFGEVRNEIELARSYRTFAAWRERRGDPTEAVQMRMRADEIFARLRGAASARVG